MKYKPLKCQELATNVIVGIPRCGIFVRMGVGKTVAALTAIDRLMYDHLKIKRVLIVAPIRVATMTWPDEIKKWSHTRHLSYVVLHGENKLEDLQDSEEVDITLINFEGLIWLAHNIDLAQRYDMCLIDESTFIKNHDATRTKKIFSITRNIPRRVIMTGSPTPNGLHGLWSQVFFLDRGASLFQNISNFRAKWFYKIGEAYKYISKEGAREEILAKIRDKIVVIEDDENVGLPSVKTNIIKVSLPVRARKNYLDIEKNFITTLDDMTELEVLNQSAQSQKLRQMLSGFVYLENKEVRRLHIAKLEALKELRDSLAGHNLFVAIQYQEDVELIRDYFKKDIPYINGNTSKKQDEQTLRRWMSGKTEMLLAHTASISHGLNLQEGGHHVVWFSLTWNLEEWEQFIARLRRRGQQSATVFNHVLAVEDSADMVMLDALNKKDIEQELVLDYFKKSMKRLVKSRQLTVS